MTEPLVAVIIVNWNNLKDTLACIESVIQSTYPNLSIIVVDNASKDDPGTMIQSMHPQVRMLQMNSNRGFTGGNNAGLQFAIQQNARYAFLLNNDAEVNRNTIHQLTVYMESTPDICAAAPIIEYHSQPGTIWSAGGRIDPHQATATMQGTNTWDQGQFGETPYPVDFATGCALMVRLSVVDKLGGLDDRFFMYYEEVEWCQRLRSQGDSIHIIPNARVWHKISPEARNESPFVHYLMTRNRLLWIRCAKFGFGTYIRVLVFHNLRTLLSWSIRPRWKYKRDQRDAMLIALRDALLNRYGPPPTNLGLRKSRTKHLLNNGFAQ